MIQSSITSIKATKEKNTHLFFYLTSIKKKERERTKFLHKTKIQRLRYINSRFKNSLDSYLSPTLAESKIFTSYKSSDDNRMKQNEERKKKKREREKNNSRKSSRAAFRKVGEPSSPLCTRGVFWTLRGGSFSKKTENARESGRPRQN